MKKLFFLKLLLIAILAGIGFAFYPQLPDIIPIHWNYLGQPDNYGPKLGTILGVPGMMLFLTILFWALPKIGPKKEKYKLFEKTWEIFQFTLLGFFAYVYLVIIYVVLHPGAPMNVFMSLGTGALFIILGNYLGKVRQNYFVGIKTPWTLANEDVWNKTHRIGGWAFIISGILFIINSFILEKYVWITFMFIITFCLFVPIIYSYVIFKKIEKK